MWNDEDNNPYSSFDRQDSSDQAPGADNDAHENAPDYSTGDQLPAKDTDEPTHSEPRKKKGGYDSRIEQILYENPDLQIIITDAGKSQESGGSYISYTIRTGDLEVRRRYSEFNSLRATLVSLHPTLIIPPIPEKHSMADYAAKPTKAKEDSGIIELRKRMLAVFLNRCRKMQQVREDGVWWRFLDPNASWSEVLHSHPVASVPKSNMKAPPLDPSNPTTAHQWLPIPTASAKLKSKPDSQAAQVYDRFPPSSQKLSEEELDPYFNNFESATRDLELLLEGQIDRVNRRTLSHLSSLSKDEAELGARYNGFSLSEQSPTVAAAIERIGQASDSSYLATEELSSNLGATFAEPMRESAQFAGVVRGVLRYRIMKRIQEELTRDELAAKRHLLDSLEKSELEASRIEQYLASQTPPGGTPRRSTSSASASSRDEDNDSDFPASTSAPMSPSSPTGKRASGGFKIFGRISHAVHGIVDVDPERTRRDQMGKTKESLNHLEQALQVSDRDVKDASVGVLQDLKRFQTEKEEDLRRYMIAYARCHIDWAKKNLETWTEAREEVDKIDVR